MIILIVAHCSVITSLTFFKTGWLPVQRNVKIVCDLESTPLEVRTNSVLGSGDNVVVYLYSAEGEVAGRVQLRFTSTLQYKLNWCTESWTNLPVTPPSATDNFWRFTLTRTAGIRLVIHCNDVEVLNTLFPQATCSESGWRNVTEINFSSGDTASDYYRAGD